MLPITVVKIEARNRARAREKERKKCDTDADTVLRQAYLLDKTSQRTVPNIFINQKHLGGCSDLLDAQKSGKLQQLLQ